MARALCSRIPATGEQAGLPPWEYLACALYEAGGDQICWSSYMMITGFTVANHLVQAGYDNDLA